MPKHISAADRTPVRVVIVTLDSHLAAAVDRARAALRRELPGLELTLHAAAEWGSDPRTLERVKEDIATADIIVATMLFMEDHIQAVLPDLRARRDRCDCVVGALASGEVIKLTRLGKFTMDGKAGGPMALLKRLRGSRKNQDGKPGGHGSGARQMAMLRRLPKILRFIPGAAQDLRAYFLTLRYWLAGSDVNIANLVRCLVHRYADGPRRHLRTLVSIGEPVDYPDVGVYHPRLKNRIAADGAKLPKLKGAVGTVGLLVMRSYVLAGNTRHYDGVIAALEARGLRVVPAFASGLDSRPAVDGFFKDGDGAAIVDAVVSLTGFSLVGGPAYNDANAAEETLAGLDVPYLAAHAIEFQTLEQWDASERGLMPVETTMMVALPELDGATGPILFGGRSEAATGDDIRGMHPHDERVAMLADRVARLVALRRAPKAERRVAAVLFNFPPNGGAVGTAAHLSVLPSLYNMLKALAADGYTVELPDSVTDLRDRLLNGNARQFGAAANVHCQIPVDDHVRRDRWLDDVERVWGPAPGRAQTDGASLFVLGARFGNVFVGVQPAFGYEGDPMRLLFERGFAPTHAFCAFYRWVREDFGAHAVLHFGTHGALEFMPGKQTGLSASCWPDRLIGDVPNLYLYAANNPSEGIVAKRRAAATLVSHLTPPVVRAGLYRGLIDLKGTLDRWRSLPPDREEERDGLAEAIQAQAAALDLARPEPAWNGHAALAVDKLAGQVTELEEALIPHGLHVVGEAPSEAERIDLLTAMADASFGLALGQAATAALVKGDPAEDVIAAGGLTDDDTVRAALAGLAETDQMLCADHETPAILRALDGRFVRPAPGGDLIRTPDVLPTGRNLHGFDPYRLPSDFAMRDGARQAEKLIARHQADGNQPPRAVAIVLWGTDNLKNEGGPIAQAMALMGAKPRFDGYGRLAGADLIPLEALGRPRIDVVMTLSGIFRDLLPLQTRLLADAAWQAASADEPLDRNFVRAHAIAHMERTGCDLETAALRVFSNADGAYGSNLNMMVDSGCWDDEDELAECYTRRKSFAYGRAGKPTHRPELLRTVLGQADLAYQNLESVELGVTTIDHYFDTLGGISRTVQRARGSDVPVYIGDQTRGDGMVRTLSEQVALETRTRVLNPTWYEGMLDHGYEGVRHIEAAVTNTMGWSATTGQVADWVYNRITETYVLDAEMRERMAKLNPAASAKVANRLLEAHERRYWSPDQAVLDALRQAGEELEDRLEGVGLEVSGGTAAA